MFVWKMNSAKTEALHREQKPVMTAADSRAQLPNHRRQVLEPKSINSSENKVHSMTAHSSLSAVFLDSIVY